MISLEYEIFGGWNDMPYSELLNLIGVDDYIHLWNADLDQPASAIRGLGSLLSLEEKKRAERFHFEKHRRRFIVCHGLLRLLLSQYTGIAPHRIQIMQGQKGKPVLSKVFNDKDIRFNLSYSKNVGLIAITRAREIGVDIEYKKRFSDYEQVIENFFSEKEKHFFHYQNEKNITDIFFKLWTKKEALLKAFGAGLFTPLNSFHVSLLDCEIVKLPSVEGFSEDKCFWQVNVLDSIPEFSASWAVEVIPDPVVVLPQE
jgi:4'-phosphopantetheinyl transferase